jgi:hypothetical protein
MLSSKVSCDGLEDRTVGAGENMITLERMLKVKGEKDKAVKDCGSKHLTVRKEKAPTVNRGGPGRYRNRKLRR